jgi:hypothetical protein
MVFDFTARLRRIEFSYDLQRNAGRLLRRDTLENGSSARGIKKVSESFLSFLLPLIPV